MPSGAPEAPAKSDALTPGVTFGRYAIEGVVGEGGMGRVYRALDTHLKRVVALKIVRPDVAGARTEAARLVREARAAAALNHPNAVAVFDVGQHDGATFIAMELVPGRSLRSYVGDARVPIDERLRWLGDVARVLAAAHARGLVHRDIKPENVVVRDDGAVKVLDFGIARRLPSAGSAAGAGARSANRGVGTIDTITEEGSFVGTPLYMAPEQLAGEPIDPRIDQFAWGIVAYELLTGQRPWSSAGSPYRELAAALAQEAPPPSARCPGLPPHVEATVLRALAKTPSERFASMSELVAALEGRASATTSGDRMSEPPKEALAEARTRGGPIQRVPRRARVAVAALAGGIVVALGIAAVVAWPTPAPQSPGRLADVPTGARRSVAVASVRALHPDAEGWRATAIEELLAGELGSGGGVRIIPGERVARARKDLGIPEGAPLTPEAIDRLRDALAADLLVTATFDAKAGRGGASASPVLSVEVVDAHSRAVRAKGTAVGRGAALAPLVADAVVPIRAALGLPEPQSDPTSRLSGTLPSDEEAARTYAEGIDEQRQLHDRRAAELFAETSKRAPGFALAYARAAQSLDRIGRETDAREAGKRALAVAGGLTREERLWVEATVHTMAGEHDEAARAYQALATFFPDDVDYVVGLLQALTLGDRPKEALVEIERVRKMPPSFADDPRIDIEEARAAHLTSDYARCLVAARRARAHAEARGNRVVLAKSTYFEGVAQLNLGHTDEALQVLEEGRGLALALGDVYTADVLSGPMANAYEARGEIARARSLLEATRAGLLQVGNAHFATAASEQLAHLDVDEGRVAEGLRGIEAAVAFYRDTQSLHSLSGALPDLAHLVAAQGDPAAAERLAHEAIAITQRTGRVRAEASAELELGYVERMRANAAGERAHDEAALALVQREGDPSGVAAAEQALGERAWLDGDLPSARRRLTSALKARDSLGDRVDAADTRLALARVALDEGHGGEAEALARDALAAFEKAGVVSGKARALAVLARTAATPEAADASGSAALAIVTSDVAGRLRAELDVARAHASSNRQAAARELAAVARAATAAAHGEIASEARRVLGGR